MLITKRAKFLRNITTLIFVLLSLLFMLQPIYTTKREKNHFLDSGKQGTIKKTISVNPSIDIGINKFARQDRVNIRVLIFTFNRPKSLLRLLESLNEVDFLGDKVAIEIWIDRSNDGYINRSIFQTADLFSFQKGIKSVFNHSRHVGLYAQWMGTWQPTADENEIALFLEDDLTVSPLLYLYLKHVHSKYKANEDINGFSLHSCTINHGTGKGNIIVPSEHLVFLYPILGTWGFSPKKENWVNFTKWYQKIYRSEKFQPFVPGILPTVWYKQFLKSGRTNTMWSMWHIYYSWINKEYCLFPNFPHCESLTKNFNEIGLHVSKKSKTTDSLLMNWTNKYNDLPEMPLKLDVKGNIVK